jgi:predicted nucleic acid-binding protein
MRHSLFLTLPSQKLKSIWPHSSENARGDPHRALALLHSLGSLVEQIGDEVYGEFEAAARDRLGGRDPEDWPILACALAIGCPIWTEDTDFFGCGVATWTSSRVEMFLRQQ